MEILLRSVAFAAGVHVPPEVRILPPRPRRPSTRLAAGRALGRLGRLLVRSGDRLAEGARDCFAAPQRPSAV